ncbi:MAG: hypothetical protein ACHQ53_11130 [Polyangiales bacterium]
MRSCSHSLLVLLAAALSLAFGSSAHAQGGVIDMGASMPDQEAKAHFKVGKSLYEAGRFAEAAQEWEQAYQLSQKPELLYNVYVASRDASDQPKAIEALRRYLESSAEMDTDTRANLQARLRVMQEANSRAPAGSAATPSPASESQTASSTPPQTTAAPQPAAAAAASADTAHGTRTASYVLLGVGGGLLAVAVATGIVASSKISHIEDRCPNDACPADYDLSGRRHDARVWRTVTLAVGGAGLLTAGVGAVLLLSQGGSSERAPAASPTATLDCGPSGCLAHVSSRF